MRILLFCGESKLAPLLARQLVIRAPFYHVTSVVAAAAQRKSIINATENGPGTCKLLVNTLKNITSEEDARNIVAKAKAEWVVWISGKRKDYANERDIFERFIRASASLHHVNTFLLISSIYSRRCPAPWWNEAALKGNKSALHDENAVELTMDECVTAMARTHRFRFRGIVLRTGELTNKKGGKVALGKTEPIGSVSKKDVAEIAAYLLDNAVTSAWLDLLEGDEKIVDALLKVVREPVDCIEGEDVDSIMKKYISNSIKRVKEMEKSLMDKLKKPTEMEKPPMDKLKKPTEMEKRPTNEPKKPGEREKRPKKKPNTSRPRRAKKKPTPSRVKRLKKRPKPSRTKLKSEKTD
ncbi:hypothetical protein MMC29_000068 [Sticta canariensis]|nr:hypothetical protein [Sticta canariensis]